MTKYLPILLILFSTQANAGETFHYIECRQLLTWQKYADHDYRLLPNPDTSYHYDNECMYAN